MQNYSQVLRTIPTSEKFILALAKVVTFVVNREGRLGGLLLHKYFIITYENDLAH